MDLNKLDRHYTIVLALLLGFFISMVLIEAYGLQAFATVGGALITYASISAIMYQFLKWVGNKLLY